MAIGITHLANLFAAASSSGLLEAAYGMARGVSVGAQNPALALRQAQRDQTRDIARTAEQPDVKRDLAAFRKAVARAGSAEALLNDPAAMKVLLTANGLGDHVAHTALARKALLSDVTDLNALANRLPDRRWKSTAQSYDFAHQGLARLRDPKVLATLEGAYAEVRWRKSLDAATPGLSDALAFRENAGKLESALAILGDPIMRRVVTTALGLPAQIAFQSIEAQERAITSRLDISRLREAKFVEGFAQRYLIARAQVAATEGGDLLSQARPSTGLLA